MNINDKNAALELATLAQNCLCRAMKEDPALIQNPHLLRAQKRIAEAIEFLKREYEQA